MENFPNVDILPLKGNDKVLIFLKVNPVKIEMGAWLM